MESKKARYKVKRGTRDLVTRIKGWQRSQPSLEAPPAGQVGGLDWSAELLFGSAGALVAMLESIVAGQGERADQRWVRFVLLWRQWELDFNEERLDEPPTLNQVAFALKLGHSEFLAYLSQSMRELFAKVGAMKATLAIPEVVDKVLEAARDAEKGGKDRELALKLGGLIDGERGPLVAIQQNFGRATVDERQREATPLLQFAEVAEAIDEQVRDSGQLLLGEGSGEGLIVEGEIEDERPRQEARRSGLDGGGVEGPGTRGPQNNMGLSGPAQGQAQEASGEGIQAPGALEAKIGQEEDQERCIAAE